MFLHSSEGSMICLTCFQHPILRRKWPKLENPDKFGADLLGAVFGSVQLTDRLRPIGL